MAALLHQQIEGKYEILAKIREGGMGAVYKVRHQLLDEVRVIKVIRHHLQATPDLADRFRREAQVAIRLRHPNIAQLHDFAVDGEGNAFIVMEFIDGITLEELAAGPELPATGLVLEIAQQALRALGFLHRRGFVHRDISPDNLMLTRGVDAEPLVKLIDLGIAKYLEGDAGLTTTGIFLGKPRYASPEQFGAEGAMGVDGRSDLYSFGVVLYELLTARCPISGRDPSSYMAGHLFRPPLEFGESDPGGHVPADLRGLVMRALAKRPEERFPTAETFGREMAAVQVRFPLGADDLEEALRSSAARTEHSREARGGSETGSTQDRLNREFMPGGTPLPAPPGSLAAASLGPATGTADGPTAFLAFDEARQAAAGAQTVARLKGSPATLRASPEETTRPLRDAGTLPLPGAARPRPPAGAADGLRLAPRSVAPGFGPDEDWASQTLDLGTMSPATRPEFWELGRGGSAAAPPPLPQPLPLAGAAVARPRRGRQVAIGTGALLVAALLGGGGWWLGRGRPGGAGESSGDEPGTQRRRAGAGSPSPPAVAAWNEEARGDATTTAPPGARIGEVVAQAGAMPPEASLPQPAATEAKLAVQPPPRRRSFPNPFTDADLLRPGPGVDEVESLEVPDAVYPDAARGTGRSATIRVWVLLDETGRVIDARAEEDSSGLGFGQAALDAARLARFLPARKDKVPGRSTSELIFEFRPQQQ